MARGHPPSTCGQPRGGQPEAEEQGGRGPGGSPQEASGPGRGHHRQGPSPGGRRAPHHGLPVAPADAGTGLSVVDSGAPKNGGFRRLGRGREGSTPWWLSRLSGRGGGSRGGGATPTPRVLLARYLASQPRRWPSFPWTRYFSPHSAPPSLEVISPCPQQAHRGLVMVGQVEDQGPALQLHQAHPDGEVKGPGGPGRRASGRVGRSPENPKGSCKDLCVRARV